MTTTTTLPRKIPLEAITSSNLAAIGYDPVRQILAVQFLRGDIYHYAGIGLELALELGAAESKGSFYAKRIRGQFQGELMTGTCPKCGDAHGWAGSTCNDCGCDVYVVPPRPETKA